MAIISEERLLIRKKLKKKGSRVSFPMDLYPKISRMLIDMNRKARIDGLISKNQVLFSINQKTAPNNKFYVIRNY